MKEVIRILEKRKSLHIEDPQVYEYWDELTEVLSKDEERTIGYLKVCSEEEIEWISEVFEDVAYRLQSETFISCLDWLCDKYPNIPIKESVDTAKSYML